MRVFLLFALSGFAVLQSGQAQDMEANPGCRRSTGERKAPGEAWLQSSTDGLQSKWCDCPMERPDGQELLPKDYCIGACLWADGPQTYEGAQYYNEGDVWEIVKDNGYTYQCICFHQGYSICDVKPGGHVCQVNDEVYRPGYMQFVVEVGDVYSDRYEECDCPDVLPAGVSYWTRNEYCRGVCFDEDNLPHYEGETYVDTLSKCFQYNCLCREHGHRDCVMNLDGGHQCILGRERYNPGVTWRRRSYQHNYDGVGYQECTCPMVWLNPKSTFFNVHENCIGICYENATTTIYDYQSPYVRADEATGEMLKCYCFDAGVELCNPV